MPLEGETWVNGIAPAENSGPGADRPSANFRFVSPGWFGAVGTPLRAGRGIVASDRGQRVVVVSERAARMLWPGESAIGKRVSVGWQKVSEVVGVAADVKSSTLEQEGSLMVYLPIWEDVPMQGSIVARTAGDPAAVTNAIRSAIRRVDPAVAVPKVRTMAQVVSRTVAARRFQVGLLGLFAMMALVTASVGIYGVISQSLASRTREIGVRMALGARPADVHRLVMREGLTPVALGLVAGIAGAVAAGRAIESLLFGVRPGDPVTIAAVCALLGAVAVVACAIPARRAAAAGLGQMLRFE
jgi:predicted permease